MKKSVYVTGMSVLTPIGCTLEEFWENCVNGVVGYDLHNDNYIENANQRIYGKVKEFKNIVSSNDQNSCLDMGRPSILALNAAILAFQDSKLRINEIDKERAAVIIGNAISDTPFCEKNFLGLETSNNLFKKGMFSFISNEVGKYFDFRGEVSVMSTGCAAGIDAIGHAFELIQSGEIDIAICGAAEAPISNITFSSFESIGALAKGFENRPKEASRPFDIERNGFVLSEGSAILILESAEHALARNARIYGEIYAYSSTNNACHMTDLKINNALEKAINDLFVESGISKNEIDYINAHGSSTCQNDSYETETFKNVFNEKVYEIPVSSTKSIIGHPLGAASAIEIVQTFLSINNSIIPPTVNCKHPSEECDLKYSENPQNKKIKYAIKTANGFSGIHSAILLGIQSKLH